MLHILTGDLEQCTAEKKPIRTVCPHICIHYVVDGAGYYDGKRLQKGQGFIVYKGDSCSYRPDIHEPWKYFWIRLWGEDTENLLEQCGLPLYSGEFEFSYAEELEAIFGSVFYNGAAKFDIQCAENPLFSESVCKLILSLHRGARMHLDYSAQKRWLKLAKEYIHANYYKPIKVEEIAAALHLDRKYLRNIFVRYTRASTREYLINLRIEKAKELLTSTNEDVSLIAASVGYEDALNFSRIFKKHVGVSPRAYRSGK